LSVIEKPRELGTPRPVGAAETKTNKCLPNTFTANFMKID